MKPKHGMQNLTRHQAKQLCIDLIRSRYSDEEMAEILVELSCKGETSDEVSGFADALLENCEPFPSRAVSIDVCGTGGSSRERFNVSTAVAFILASLGLRIAKHGNRGSRKPNGSFDLLEMLEIPIDLNGERLSEILEKTSLAFIYARKFHPAMKHVANARKIAGRRTIFNLAGPLSNPANVRKQVIGTADPGFFDLLLAASRALGRENCIVVSGHPGIDEFSITGDTTYQTTWSDGRVHVIPEQIGIKRAVSADIPCGDAVKNAKEFVKLVNGSGNHNLEAMVCVNSGLVMTCNDPAMSIQEGIRLSREAIHKGLMKDKFEEYRKMAAAASD